ncbi:MAG: pentapeptide repeat-containing protein [Pirellulales bacterium]
MIISPSADEFSGLDGSRLDGWDFSGQDLTSAELWLTSLNGANLAAANLTSVWLTGSNLANANLAQANLTHARLFQATLGGTNFDGAVINYADLGNTVSLGFTASQLASTASYKSRNLQGVDLAANDISGWDLSDQNLTDAQFNQATLNNTSLTGAVIVGANFTGTTSGGFTRAQLESTASYQAKDMRGILLSANDLVNWSFKGQDLTNAVLNGAILNGADFTDANVARAAFAGTTMGGLTQAQFKSTESFRSRDLRLMNLSYNDLSGWDLRGQDLKSTNLQQSALDAADFTGADLRGVFRSDLTGAIIRNTIQANGDVAGLTLIAGESLLIGDDDGVDTQGLYGWPERRDPYPVTIRDRMEIKPGGKLQVVFDSDAWGSTIRFQPGIPVELGGVLELGFDDNIPVAAQSGRTMKIFDWTGVTPQGEFALSSQAGQIWDASKLYTTGEISLLGISSDLTGDQQVDSEDLLNFLAKWTGSDYPSADRTWHDGDSDADGDVDSADMLVFLSQWTGAAAAEAQSVVSVPEPSRLPIAGLGIAPLVARIRRRTWKPKKPSAMIDSKVSRLR